MNITTYGIIAGLSSLLSLGFVNLNLKSLLILLFSIIISRKICHGCDKTFNMVSFMPVFSILTMTFYNCKEIYNIILAFSIFAAISRIGCLFAGCCTGKESKSILSLKYEGNYVININTNKKIIRVTPSIILEIFLQFLFVYIILKSNNPLLLFGILNASLILASDYWRHGGRALDKNICVISSAILILFSIISIFKCKKIIKPKIVFKLNIYKIILSLLLVVISSNNIIFENLYNKQYLD